MDADDRPVTADAVVDHELRALLAVEPSADFAARVRARIAREPPTRASWLPQTLAVAGAAAAVVVAAIVLTRTLPDAPATEDRAARGIALLEARPLAVNAVPLPPIAHRGVSTSANRILAFGESATTERLEPDVLIDGREVAALRALIAGVRAGRVDLAPVLAATAPAPMELPPIADIAIQPIVIDPLEQGVRQ